ncbi:IclR family transcriptional regulator [Natronosalvus rutilus]|uniref:IclR family transcriptional regulator n=1 Tax=Natronosalvus rutilus TaxID=2953753 RepID=A0A9E7N8K5_9EURY|nr:IclR family transcriptional regulator [Natronosalvus rutilus]UTF52235.1 IclR family transcriptional regulator [Natronosalvus rutilus]
MADKGGINAVRTSFQIVHALREADEGMGVSELARELNLPVSTVHSHLSTLHDCEYVTKRGSKYSIGYRFLEVGGSVRNHSRLFEYARPKVDQLADEFGDKVSLCVLDHGLVAYTYIAKGEEAIETDTFTGIRLLPHSCASGKAILAHLPDKHRTDVLKRRGLSQVGPNTITDRDELLTELETIQSEGVAFDRQERLEGIRSVAAPIPREGNQPNAAISISAPISRMSDERFEREIPERVQNIAETIRIKLRYA